jgi:hypothetical protein
MPRMYPYNIYSHFSLISGQDKRAAEKKVANLLVIKQELDAAVRRLDGLKSQPLDANERGDGALDEAEAEVERLRSRIQKMEAVIGAGFAGMTLKEASCDPFLAARLAAHGLKERLLKRIQARKFELSKLNQHMGRTSLGKLYCFLSNKHSLPAPGNKLYMHTKSSVGRRDSGIKYLASAFNNQVDLMLRLKTSVAKYRGQLVPQKVDLKRLFHLDILSPIWEDGGLLSSDDVHERWRIDRSIQDGIQSLLEQDRCNEERERLEWELDQAAKWGMDMAHKMENCLHLLGA